MTLKFTQASNIAEVENMEKLVFEVEMPQFKANGDEFEQLIGYREATMDPEEGFIKMKSTLIPFKFKNPVSENTIDSFRTCIKMCSLLKFTRFRLMTVLVKKIRSSLSMPCRKSMSAHNSSRGESALTEKASRNLEFRSSFPPHLNLWNMELARLQMSRLAVK